MLSLRNRLLVLASLVLSMAVLMPQQSRAASYAITPSLADGVPGLGNGLLYSGAVPQGTSIRGGGESVDGWSFESRGGNSTAESRVESFWTGSTLVKARSEQQTQVTLAPETMDSLGITGGFTTPKDNNQVNVFFKDSAAVYGAHLYTASGVTSTITSDALKIDESTANKPGIGYYALSFTFYREYDGTLNTDGTVSGLKARTLNPGLTLAVYLLEKNDATGEYIRGNEGKALYESTAATFTDVDTSRDVDVAAFKMDTTKGEDHYKVQLVLKGASGNTSYYSLGNISLTTAEGGIEPNPVPEPGSLMAMGGFALIGAAWAIRRRRHLRKA